MSWERDHNCVNLSCLSKWHNLFGILSIDATECCFGSEEFPFGYWNRVSPIRVVIHQAV
jgi:hypothetical protein